MHVTLAAIAAPEPSRGRLLCPVCRCQRIEPVSLACNSLGGQRGEARIDADGIHLDPMVPPAEGGSAIAITWRCREGHLFASRLRCIHGSTIAEMTVLPFAIAAQGRDRN